MAIISFENIAPNNNDAEIPDGFRRLDWDTFLAVDDGIFNKFVGNTNAIRTGEAAAVGGYDGGSASFRSPDRDNDFDLNNGYFTAANAANLTVKVFGFDDGERVAKKVLTLDPDQEFVRFGAQFDDIDEVKFTPTGGTDDPNDPAPFGHAFAVDDLFIDF